MDATLFHAINGLAGAFTWLDDAMVLTTKYLPFAFVIALVLYYFSSKAARQRASLRAGVSALGALGIAQVITHLFPRPRPYMALAAHLLISKTNDPSFPSDHATLSFAVATTLWNVDKRTGILWVALAALVGFSRIFVGTHYPTDVIGGAVLGISVSLIVDLLAKQARIASLIDKVLSILYKYHLAVKPTE